MALKATVYKATLHIADLDRGYYADHHLTLACHPSETEERLMARLLSFALFAGEHLQFCRGISSDDEPDLWEKDLTGRILRWIELGQPDESRVRKACNRSDEVVLVCYSGRAAATWWEKNRDALARHANLRVLNIPKDGIDALVGMCDRTMDLTLTLQDGSLLVNSASLNAEITPEHWR